MATKPYVLEFHIDTSSVAERSILANWYTGMREISHLTPPLAIQYLQEKH